MFFFLSCKMLYMERVGEESEMGMDEADYFFFSSANPYLSLLVHEWSDVRQSPES